MKPAMLAALIIGAAAAGAAGYLVFEQRQPATEPLPPAMETAPKTLATTLPTFQLADRDGKMRSLQDWTGKSLIVNFWATWCAPCRREIPLLEKIQVEYGPEGFQVIGIAADYRDKVIAYADEIGLKYPLLIGEQEALDAATAFGVEAVGFPFTIFADRHPRGRAHRARGPGDPGRGPQRRRRITDARAGADRDRDGAGRPAPGPRGRLAAKARDWV
jgi:thiol-disulfide isomerase/thioredoxin